LGENVILWRLREHDKEGISKKTWKEVMDKDMNDLDLKASDAMDHREWKEIIEIIRGNWSNRNSNSDALSSLSQFKQPFSRWIWVSRYQNVSILDLIGAKNDGGGGDNRSYKTCKAPVKSSPPAKQHSDAVSC